MLDRIFPKQFDNNYRGHWLGIVLLVLIALVKGTQGFACTFNTLSVITTADGIPLDGYSPGAINVIVALFAVVGLYLVVLPLQSLVVLLRYRTMIPFMYVLFLFVQLASRGIQMLHPIERSATTSMGYAGHPVGFYVNLVILALTVIGFLLSLQGKAATPR